MVAKDINNQLADALFHISRVMKQHMTSDETVSQLTVMQLETLVFLKKNNGSQMNEIASHFHITMPTATALLNKLVKTELVSREADEHDRRIVRVVLTDAGKTLLEKGLKQRSEKVNQMLNLLSSEEKNQLLKIMQTILARIEI